MKNIENCLPDCQEVVKRKLGYSFSFTYDLSAGV